jgi:hypothetical protein
LITSAVPVLCVPYEEVEMLVEGREKWRRGGGQKTVVLSVSI